jgi:hypothetical protein
VGRIASPWTLPPILRPYRSLSLQFPAVWYATAYFFHWCNRLTSRHGAVRSVPKGGAVVVTVPRPPFVLFGRDPSPSVFPETIKRGDLDVDGKNGPRTNRHDRAANLRGIWRPRFRRFADQCG